MFSFSIRDEIEQFYDLTSIGDIQDLFDRSAKMRPTEVERLIDFGEKLTTGSFGKRDGTYDFVADTRLSGLPLYCRASECRFKAVDALGKFAVLYTDTTYMINPFNMARLRYNALIHKRPNINDDDIRQLANDLSLAVHATLSLRQLLERGIVKYVQFTPYNTCTNCLKDMMDGIIPNESPVSVAYQYLLDSTRCVTEENDGHRVFRIEYDETHSEHSLIKFYDEEVMERYPVGSVLTDQQVTELNLFHEEASLISHDIYSKSYFSNTSGAQNLLSSPAELGIVKLFKSPGSKFGAVKIDYPIANDLSLGQALKVRDQEWHHFVEFREHVRQATEANLGDQDISDMLASEVAKVEGVVSQSQRTANRGLVDAFTVGAFSIGAIALTGGLPGAVSTVAGILGAGHSTRKAINLVRSKLETPDEARQSKFYYAWRLGKVLSS